jgi:leader peptidase (prepilin peptidase) / N-methyltransferase
VSRPADDAVVIADQQQLIRTGPRSYSEVATLLAPTRRDGLVTLAAVMAAAAASLTRFGLSAEGLAGAVFLAVIALLAVADHRAGIYPNLIVLPACVVVLVLTLPAGGHRFGLHLAAGLALGAVLFAVALAFPGGIGMGDVKVAALIGFALGGATLIAAGVALLGFLLVCLWARSLETRRSFRTWPIWAAVAASAFLLGGW